jgi:hypothetical protein
MAVARLWTGSYSRAIGVPPTSKRSPMAFMRKVSVSTVGDTSSASRRLIADWWVPVRRAKRAWLSPWRRRVVRISSPGVTHVV